MMSPEEWAAKQLIESRSDEVEENLDRWTKYDKLRMCEDLDRLFEYLTTDAYLDKFGRDLVDRSRISYLKIFYNDAITRTNKTH